MSFSLLGLSQSLIRAVHERNYSAPTPIQTVTIPAVLRGEDILAIAQTGSGKTAAFALPILQQLLQASESTREIYALILVPTRELAAQIGESFRSYARYSPKPLKIITAFGGVSINPQMMALRGGAEIVVATPGRLLDLVNHNALRLSATATLVLDEADKLFDLGFSDELARIIELLPAQRQNLFFSATFPHDVQVFAERLLQNPTRIEIDPDSTSASAILQRAIQVEPSRRTQLLRHLIQENDWSRVLVFVATKYSTEHIAEKLRRVGINAASLHGELSQSARSQALADFKATKLQVLIATDVAARGIDIAQLPVVVNYDLPRSAVDYVHRIGRTGRAGQNGIAVSFICPNTEEHFRLIEKRNHLKLVREQIPGFEPSEPAILSDTVNNQPIVNTNIGGIKGKRKSKKDKLREAAAHANNLSTNLSSKPSSAAIEANISPWGATRRHRQP